MARVINVTGKVQGRLIITPPTGGVLRVQREYTLVGDDALLDEIPLRLLERNVTYATLPQNIKDALTTIDAYTSGEIDTEEGL